MVNMPGTLSGPAAPAVRHRPPRPWPTAPTCCPTPSP